MNDTGSAGTGLILLLLLIAAYFLPVVIAMMRKSAGVGMIFAVNLLLGWSIIGWFICLLWAAMGQTKAQRAFYERAAGDGSTL